MGIHDKCPATEVQQDRVLRCDKSPEHVYSLNSIRRKHYDASEDKYWTPAAS
jgi:hypothetical protein